ncbi:MAG TPA: methylated-DNA--[protein]-cysteine S-methyltransferase [Pirellulales bacterium]|jgi:methylated-DNA-[protein]-cysteine S-methyltransferase|nr:methylated-DNA--[protein]-cysteine S-methyltransferase [Pirellulales bacterium]
MTRTTYYSLFDSPLGEICLEGDGLRLSGLHLAEHRHWRGLDPQWIRHDEPFARVRGQLTEYFAGQRQTFDLELHCAGTPFQQRVWQELCRIPFGTTISYAQLASRIERPTASRAVGHANGRNPVSIIVPCHRVIGADGSLTGYGGGMECKRWLLDWERRVLGEATPRPQKMLPALQGIV